MITLINTIVPFKGFKAMNLFGILFVRKEYAEKIDQATLRHESIHSRQCWEMLGVLFYAWYLIEWLARLFQYGFNKSAYRNISFEREAYANETEEDYLSERKPYSFFKYIIL